VSHGRPGLRSFRSFRALRRGRTARGSGPRRHLDLRPLTRMTDDLIRRAVPLLTDTASALAEELDLVGALARSA